MSTTAQSTPTALSPQPTVPDYPDDLQWVTAYLVAHMMSETSRRYVYALWFCIASVFVVYTILHWTGKRGGVFGCYWRKWSIRRRTWRVGARDRSKGRGFAINWPSNGQMLSLAALPITTIMLSFVGPDYISPHVNVFDIRPQKISARAFDITPYLQYQPQYQIHKAWWTSGGRTGLIAYGLMPLVVLFALKTPPFAVLALPITNLHFDKLSWLHRWSARLLYFIVVLHVVTWSVQLSIDYRKGQPGFNYAWQYEKFIFAWIAFGSMTLLVFSSSRFFRHAHYETFYYLHILLIPLTIVFSALHHPPVAHWCWVALGIWVGERAWRAVWWLQINGYFGREKAAPVIMPATPSGAAPGEHGKYPPHSPFVDSRFFFQPDGNLMAPSSALEYTPPPGYAHAELLSGATVRLTYITPGFLSWSPGQHFLINVPSVSRFLTHPFTAASICDHQSAPSGRAIIFLVRCKSGWTRDLWDHVVTIQNRGENHVSSERPPNGTVMPERGVLVKMNVEGPFGSSSGTKWGNYSSVVIFSAGSGVSFALSILKFVCLCLAGRDGRKLGGHAGSWGTKGYKTQRIRWVWLIKEYAHLQWCASILRRCMSMIPAPGLEIEIFVTNSPPELRRLSRIRASRIEPAKSQQSLHNPNEEDDDEDDDVDLSYYSENIEEDDPDALNGISMEDYMRDLTDWDNELDDRLAGESRFSTLIRREGNMLRRISKAPPTSQKPMSFLITDPDWMPPGLGAGDKTASFLSVDWQPHLHRGLFAPIEESPVKPAVSSPLREGFPAEAIEPPYRPSLDSVQSASDLEAPGHPSEEPEPRPSWDESWQQSGRRPVGPSALSKDTVRSSWDSSWDQAARRPPALSNKPAASSPLKSGFNDPQPEINDRRMSTESYESDLGRPVTFYEPASDPVPRPLSPPRQSRAVSPPPLPTDPNTPSSSMPMLTLPVPPARPRVRIPTDQEKHVVFQNVSPMLPRAEVGLPKLHIEDREMRDISTVSMNARPGRPSLQKILHEEVENAKGSVVVACCGPASFNAMVRKAVGLEIDPKKASEGRGYIELVSEDFEF